MKSTSAALGVLLGALCVPGSPTLGQVTQKAPEQTVNLVEEHWPGGQLRLRKHVLHRDDGTVVDHGSFERWHDNGEKEYEAVFVHGKKEGTTVRYHKNGRKATQQEYRNGRRHGPSITWDATGAKVKEENWADGKPHGIWTVWQDGEVKWRHSYDHGVPASLPDKPPAS